MKMIRQVNLDMDDYRGLSTDTKPSGITNGSTFLEIDTGTRYMYDEEGDEWYAMPDGGGSGGGGGGGTGTDPDAVHSTDVQTIVVLTQAQYDALATKDANTEYNIIGASS